MSQPSCIFHILLSEHSRAVRNNFLHFVYSIHWFFEMGSLPILQFRHHIYNGISSRLNSGSHSIPSCYCRSGCDRKGSLTCLGEMLRLFGSWELSEKLNRGFDLLGNNAEYILQGFCTHKTHEVSLSERPIILQHFTCNEIGYET